MKTSEVLDQLDGWLRSLGIEPKRDRWHQAAEMVKQANEQRELIERGGLRAPINNYVDGLFDATEIYEIMRAFQGNTSAALKAKLARGLCGPVSPLEERPTNSAARNTMFELSLAADWKNGGVDVEVGEPDIRIRFGIPAFQVECKRPFSENSVRSNIADAASQLGNNLDRPGSENDYGIVAISLSRVFTKGNLVCFAPEGTGRQVIGETLAEMLDENTKRWGLRRFREFHDRIVAVMFHLAAPWDIRGERLIHLSTSNFIETGKNATGWKILTKNLENLRQTIN
ncbi:MAG: hypothetical protein WA857_03890 [Candidatus Acidiferrum sp.]